MREALPTSGMDRVPGIYQIVFCFVGFLQSAARSKSCGRHLECESTPPKHRLSQHPASTLSPFGESAS
jgi:hypothetical protein